MSEETLRLSKLMGQRGLCSRREADKLIEQGLVKVDGVIVTELGTKVRFNCQIEILKTGQQQLQNKHTIILYKPIGYVSGPKEDDYPSALDLIQYENNASEKRVNFDLKDKTGMAPAGRLDVDSTGLLIYTSDGRVAKALIGDSTKIEKHYRVKVTGTIKQQGLNLLRHGLELDNVPLRPANVEWEIENKVLTMTLKQGRKRQVRRMCEAVGLKATALKRTGIGNLNLNGLNPGQWRLATESEIQQLLSATK